MTAYTAHQGTFFAHRITLEGFGEESFAQSLSTARVDMNPHQVDAALFALSSPLTKGVLLADEVGLGKGASARAKELRDATRAFFKVLLTATPLHELVSVLDEHFFGEGTQAP
jgi:hypothetical protein